MKRLPVPFIGQGQDLPTGCESVSAAMVLQYLGLSVTAEEFARGEELLSAGLDVPQITRIAMELKRRGVDIDPAVYTVEALECQLLALRKGGAGC